jgi:nucleoside-diphosphate-sugar epimerase
MSGDKLKAIGWRPRIDLRHGIADAYRAFLAESADAADAARRSGRCC